MSDSNRAGTALAVDIGGTKIAAARVTSEGQVLSRRREVTAKAGPPAVIDQLTRLLIELRDESDGPVVGVGIGIPAVLERGSDLVIWGPNLPGFRNVKLREPLEAALQLPVCLEYDGHTAVLGEWWQGAGRGFQSVVFVIIGTGIGGGMVLDGKLYRGVNRLAGAAGWFTLATEIDEEGADLVIANSRDESQFKPVPVPKGVTLKEARIMKRFFDYDVFLNMNISKEHSGNNLSCSMKNLMGINSPKSDQTFHRYDESGMDDIEHLDQCIADLNTIISPDLCIVDSTVFVVTNGPDGPGKLKKPQKVVAGTNPVAIDTYCSTLFGYDPKEVTVLKKAYKHGLGEMDLGKLKILEVEL